jgi:hypothetical protein
MQDGFDLRSRIFPLQKKALDVCGELIEKGFRIPERENLVMQIRAVELQEIDQRPCPGGKTRWKMEVPFLLEEP